MLLFNEDKPKGSGSAYIFKYISCYYLTFRAVLDVLMAMKFKYISCYYLTERDRRFQCVLDYSNTSHVII